MPGAPRCISTSPRQAALAEPLSEPAAAAQASWSFVPEPMEPGAPDTGRRGVRWVWVWSRAGWVDPEEWACVFGGEGHETHLLHWVWKMQKPSTKQPFHLPNSESLSLESVVGSVAEKNATITGTVQPLDDDCDFALHTLTKPQPSPALLDPHVAGSEGAAA